MPLFWTVVLVAMPALGSPRQTPESELLADSELIYRVSGGFAGVVRTAKLVAKAGRVTGEYTGNDERMGGGRQEGPREPSAYLELWAEAERAGMWTMQIPGKQKGADLMHHELAARVGERRHSVSWTDGDASSASARDALRIAERILALAREAAAER